GLKCTGLSHADVCGADVGREFVRAAQIAVHHHILCWRDDVGGVWRTTASVVAEVLPRRETRPVANRLQQSGLVPEVITELETTHHDDQQQRRYHRHFRGCVAATVAHEASEDSRHHRIKYGLSRRRTIGLASAAERTVSPISST